MTAGKRPHERCRRRRGPANMKRRTGHRLSLCSVRFFLRRAGAKGTEHLLQLPDVQLRQGMAQGVPAEDVVMGEDIVAAAVQRQGGEGIVLGMLPDGGADEKAAALGHDVLAARTVIDGDDAPGRLLKQAVDRGGGAVVKAGGLQLDHAPRYQLQRRLLILAADLCMILMFHNRTAAADRTAESVCSEGSCCTCTITE